MAEKTKNEEKTEKKVSIGRGVMVVLTILALSFIILFIKSWWPDPDSDSAEGSNGRRVTQVTQVINATPRYDQLIATLDPGGETEEIRIPSGRRYCVDAWDPELIQVIHRDRFGIEHEYSPGDPEATYDIMSYRIQNISEGRFEIETYQVPFGESCNS